MKLRFLNNHRRGEGAQDSKNGEGEEVAYRKGAIYGFLVLMSFTQQSFPFQYFFFFYLILIPKTVIISDQI